MWWLRVNDDPLVIHYSQLPRLTESKKTTFKIPELPKNKKFKRNWWERVSGYEYLGPFTDLSKVGHVDPTNELDEIAMRHDLAYAKASSEREMGPLGTMDYEFAKSRADLFSGAEMVGEYARQNEDNPVFMVNPSSLPSLIAGGYLIGQGLFRGASQLVPKLKGFELPW